MHVYLLVHTSWGLRCVQHLHRSTCTDFIVRAPCVQARTALVCKKWRHVAAFNDVMVMPRTDIIDFTGRLLSRWTLKVGPGRTRRCVRTWCATAGNETVLAAVNH